MRKWFLFFKQETVLCLAALAALCSVFWCPPSAAYLRYFDFRTLSLLFCLMLVVAGLQSLGLFTAAMEKLLTMVRNTRQLAAALILSCFFSSMLLTNDVALITFVPFAIYTLTQINRRRFMILILVMQTLAANLGSMLTPLGNPQNLYLSGAAQLSLPDFLAVTGPVSALAFVLILLSLLLIPRHPLPQLRRVSYVRPAPKGKAAAFGFLFTVCFLCVIHLLPYPVMLILVIAGGILLNPALFRRIDYSLLATFAVFFLFVGNLKELPAVYALLQQTVTGRELEAAVLSSQIISNVPAAILLSGFTRQYTRLLLGVNLGGLGTLIASMASLISFRLYSRRKSSRPGKYLLIFTGLNLVFLLVLYGAVRLLYPAG